MNRFLELIFYVGYLRIEKSESEQASHWYLLISTLLHTALLGFLFLNALIIFIGIAFNIPLFKLVIIGLYFEIPTIIVAPLVSILFYYFLSIRNNKYLDYKIKYIEVTKQNLYKYVQKYVLLPYMVSLMLLLISVYLTFKTGRGV